MLMRVVYCLFFIAPSVAYATDFPFFHRTDPIENTYEISATLLGKGSFGSVMAGRNKATGENVAIKIIEVNSKNYLKVNREPLLLRYLASAERKHDHLVQFKDSFFKPDADKMDTGTLYLVMERVYGVDSFDFIVANSPMGADTVIHLVSQMTSALRHLKKMGIAHRDLKPENMRFVQENGDLRLKIFDFGMAKLFNLKAEKRDTDCGSPHYVPPEVFLDGVPKLEQRDSYSIGVIAYMMLTAKFPWLVYVDSERPEYGRLLVDAIRNNRFNHIKEDPENPRHNEVANFVHQLLAYEDKRPDPSVAGENLLDPMKTSSLQVVYPRVKELNLRAVKYLLAYIALEEFNVEPRFAIRSIFEGNDFIVTFYEFLATQFPDSPVLDVEVVNEIAREAKEPPSRYLIVKFFIEKMDVSKKTQKAARRNFSLPKTRKDKENHKTRLYSARSEIIHPLERDMAHSDVATSIKKLIRRVTETKLSERIRELEADEAKSKKEKAKPEAVSSKGEATSKKSHKFWKLKKNDKYAGVREEE